MLKSCNAVRQPKVLLVSMPWAPYREPSLGLSILSSELNKHKIENEVKYFNIFLLKYLKASTYEEFTDLPGINEFLFSFVFEKNITSNQIQLLDKVLSGLIQKNNGPKGIRTRAKYLDLVLKIRNEIIPKFLTDCLDFIKENEYTVIGFTCMFDQTIANLALAKLVREQIPQTLICFGGYALEGIVGYQILKSFHFVDIVCQGDGEPAICKIAELSIDEGDIKNVPNIIYRNNNGVISTNKKIKILLNDSPNPDYEWYFKNLKRLKKEHKIEIRPNVLPLESSRGCWWGQKSHCVFCGIDEESLKYRQKSSELVIGMFYALIEKYPDYTFRLVDYILPYKYFKSVLPVLANDERELKISCEMKSNITYDNFHLLSKAGFIQVQPGIESFSTNVLKAMKKGVSGIQNVLTLKLGKSLGIKVDWNLLYGFPNDKIEDYEPLVKQIPLLYHFDPPYSCTNVLITRFAPLQTTPEIFGIEKASAHMTYGTIFSEEYRERINLNLDDLCYIFETNWKNTEHLEFIYRLIDSQVHFWKSADRKNCTLSHIVLDKGILFIDNRLLNKTPKEIKLGQIHSILYQSIDLEIKSKRKIKELFMHDFDETQIDSVLNDLVDERLVYEENEKYIGLSIDNKEAPSYFPN